MMEKQQPTSDCMLPTEEWTLWVLACNLLFLMSFFYSWCGFALGWGRVWYIHNKQRDLYLWDILSLLMGGGGVTTKIWYHVTYWEVDTIGSSLQLIFLLCCILFVTWSRVSLGACDTYVTSSVTWICGISRHCWWGQKQPKYDTM